MMLDYVLVYRPASLTAPEVKKSQLCTCKDLVVPQLCDYCTFCSYKGDYSARYYHRKEKLLKKEDYASSSKNKKNSKKELDFDSLH